MPGIAPCKGAQNPLLWTDSFARLYLEDLRWGGQPVCPYCEAKEASQTVKGWRCRACGKRYSVTIRTIMESTRLPLVKWIAAIHLASNDEEGITARDLAEHLDVTVRCAYHLLARMRDGARHISVQRQKKLAFMERNREIRDNSTGRTPRSVGPRRHSQKQRGACFTLWPLHADAAVKALITLPSSRWLDSH